MSTNPYAKITEKDLVLHRYLFNQFVALCFYIKSLFKGYRFHIVGRENIPSRKLGSVIVAANHVSDMDPPLVSVAMLGRAISYMAKEELFRTPRTRLFYRLLGTFAVNRQKMEMATIRSALAVLRSGSWCLGIFPEGTRNADGSVQEAKKGVAFIAKNAKAAVLPMGIHYGGPQGKEIYIKIGELLPYQAADDIDQCASRIQQTINALVAEMKALSGD